MNSIKDAQEIQDNIFRKMSAAKKIKLASDFFRFAQELKKSNYMKQEIRKNNKNLIIKLSVPLKARRYNPYNKSNGDEMDNIVGVIAGDEIGFAYRIDRKYKGKGDDVSDLFYLYQGDYEEFEKVCKKIGIKVVKYPNCDYCFKPIFGIFTVGKKGNLCFECKK